jgi:hypothetical protein
VLASFDGNCEESVSRKMKYQQEYELLVLCLISLCIIIVQMRNDEIFFLSEKYRKKQHPRTHIILYRSLTSFGRQRKQ